MPFYEFCMKSFSYARQNKEIWRKTRYIAYHAFWSYNIDPKTLPASQEKMLPLDGVRKILKATQEAKDRVILEYVEYLKNKNELHR